MGHRVTIELSDDARVEMRRIEIEEHLSPQEQITQGWTLLRLYLSAKVEGRRMVIEDVHGRNKDLVELPGRGGSDDG